MHAILSQIFLQGCRLGISALRADPLLEYAPFRAGRSLITETLDAQFGTKNVHLLTYAPIALATAKECNK
jgi:hypothetical protein